MMLLNFSSERFLHIRRMANVQFLCPKVILVHQDSTVGEEKEHNQQSCNSEDTFDILKKPKALNVKVSIANASNSKISSYSEKLLPFNKRKSQYYVWQEGESVVPSTEDNSCPGNEMDWTEKNVKVRSLRSIYRTTRPITAEKRNDFEV